MKLKICTKISVFLKKIWNEMRWFTKKEQKFNNETDSDSQVSQNRCLISDNDYNNSINLLFIFQNLYNL